MPPSSSTRRLLRHNAPCAINREDLAIATGPSLVFGQLTFPLNKITNSVGRKDRITNMVPDVDLGTLDQERSVSRRHAELGYDHGTIVLRDVGSTNGTTVNDERLAHQVDRPLRDGDHVGFGGVEMTFAAEVEWPEGVEPEWPPEVPEAAPEETMIARPADFASSETAIFAPGSLPVPAEVPEAALAAPEETAPVAPEALYEAPVYVSCSNHPHLPAIGVCPGCLEAFCVDCLPEREDGLMVCNRCAGISYRLGAASALSHGDAHALAAAAAMPASSAFPEPTPAVAFPQPAPPPEDGDKKKKWPF